MRPSQRPAAKIHVFDELGRFHAVETDGGLNVPQLPEIEVSSEVVARPPKEEVAGRLEQPLPADHALAVIVESALAEMRLQNGRLRLLVLEDESVVLVRHEEQDGAAHADAA